MYQGTSNSMEFQVQSNVPLKEFKKVSKYTFICHEFNNYKVTEQIGIILTKIFMFGCPNRQQMLQD